MTCLCVAALNSCKQSDVKLIHTGVYLEKNDKGYVLIFDPNTAQEWRYYKVDSLAIGKQYSFLFFGKSKEEAEQKWFYVAGAPKELKKGFGDWYDAEFRKYRLNEIDKNRHLYQALRSTEEIWNE